jgi:superfamily II DNA or RNA helicase
MKIEEVKPGVHIAGSKWPESVEINKVENFGNHLRLIGATKSGKHIDQVISIAELNNIRIVQVGVDFSTESWKAFLALETIRYRFASLYDPLLAMNTSKVDPLPHQIEAVYGYVLKLPRIRFLIADDPGAGKTIMAGLIIKELKLRKIAKRFLLVVPGHLRDQWLRELKDRFEESFTFVDRNYMDAHYAENVWEKENQIITSIDFAKRTEILPAISSALFDFILVDEAHKMSAYRYGEKISKTDRYLLGEVLSKATEHFLFLTATPHKGDPENFRLLLDLLEPGFFADSKMLTQSIENKDNPLFIRRIKEDLKDFEGKPLFLPRHVKTLAFKLSNEEMLLYNAVSEYVNEQYNKALVKDRRRNVAFALIILQRRIASSTFALFKSLIRRKDKLQGLMDMANKNGELPQSDTVFDFEETEDEDEQDRWKEEALWETLSVAENREELQREIDTLVGLIDQAKTLIESESEVKLQQLKSTMQDLQNKNPGEKVLIFTESKDTLEYLEKRIRSWGYSINVIHGGMSLEDRVAAERIFKNETQVMVATEAAGEGINLQFCHLMINYDIPWNPNRLEQRMGRIHRYGQTKEVYIFNLVAANTREGMVLEKIFKKLDEIRDVMNSDKVFDVISEVLYDQDLSLLLLEAAANARNIEEILKDLDIRIDAEYINKVKENLGESLATKYIDYTRIREMAEKARENRLIPEYTRSFFTKAFIKAGGSLRERKDGFIVIDSVPYEIRSIAGEDIFRRRYGYLLRSYPKITFDKDLAFKNSDAEFVSFGHPLFEAMLDWVEKSFSSDLMKGSTFVDPSGTLSGHLLFYEGEITDGTGEIAGRKLFTYHINDKNEVNCISSAILWDLAESPSGTQLSIEGINVDGLKNSVFQASVVELEKYLSQLQEERERQAQIKIKYGVKSLDKLVVKLDGDLIALIDRKARGENVDLVMRNKEEQKKKYGEAKKELEDILEKERNLTMSTPKFVGIIRVISSPHVEDAMKTDKEIERVGMELAMKYEVAEGRFPENVESEDLGFDIRSRDINGKVVRYIEVKARAQTGDVALTQNEWFKAQRLNKDFYLYAVMNAGSSKPTLFSINDPVANLAAIERIEAVRFMISAEELLLKGLKTR